MLIIPIYPHNIDTCQPGPRGVRLALIDFGNFLLLQFSQHCWNQLVPVAIVSFRYLLVCHPVFCHNKTEKKVISFYNTQEREKFINKIYIYILEV